MFSEKATAFKEMSYISIKSVVEKWRRQKYGAFVLFVMPFQKTLTYTDKKILRHTLLFWKFFQQKIVTFKLKCHKISWTIIKVYFNNCFLVKSLGPPRKFPITFGIKWELNTEYSV